MPKLQPLPEEHMYQAYGIYLLESKHRFVRRLKKAYQPSVHGHKTWDASFLLMDYLQHNPLKKKSRVLEVGCGWGPGSVFCAKQFKAKVTGLDIDREVFPFLDVLAELNGVSVEPMTRRLESLKGADLGKFDVIVGSDICFWDSLVQALNQMINRALKNGVERIIITDPGRPTFYELCDLARKKHDVELVEWYAPEPNHFVGEVVEIRPR
jgi:predicted nicotinamide N-methyase